MRQSPEKVLPILSIPDDYPFKSFSQLMTFYDYLNGETIAAFVGKTNIHNPTPLFEVPFNREEALILLGSLTVLTTPQLTPFVSSAVEFPEIKTIFFESCDIFGFLRYGDDPNVAMLPLMKFDIDNGFTHAHDDPGAEIISAKLQDYFIAWRDNNYRGTMMPETCAVNFAVSNIVENADNQKPALEKKYDKETMTAQPTQATIATQTKDPHTDSSESDKDSTSSDSFDVYPDEVRKIFEKYRSDVIKFKSTIPDEKLFESLKYGEAREVKGEHFNYVCLFSPKKGAPEAQASSEQEIPQENLCDL